MKHDERNPESARTRRTYRNQPPSGGGRYAPTSALAKRTRRAGHKMSVVLSESCVPPTVDDSAVADGGNEMAGKMRAGVQCVGGIPLRMPPRAKEAGRSARLEPSRRRNTINKSLQLGLTGEVIMPERNDRRRPAALIIRHLAGAPLPDRPTL